MSVRIEDAERRLEAAIERLESAVELRLAGRPEIVQELDALRVDYAALKEATRLARRRLDGTIDRLEGMLEN